MTDSLPNPAGSTPADAYRGVVSEVIESRRSSRPYPPGTPQLTIAGRHRPRALADLAPAEAVQLHAAWYSDGGPSLASALADEENDVEAAVVLDETGATRYRLYGWNFGVGYLFPVEGLDLVAFGAQHDLEHWSVAQRELFAGLDRAMRAGGHGFAQPLNFCWDIDTCWDEIADAPPHTVGSEPYLREAFSHVPPLGV